MIPNMWYAVAESREVPAGKPVGLRRLGEELVFWRDARGEIAVARDLCPHRLAKLSPGKVVGDNLQCHFHGFQFDRTGACQLVPANGRNGPKPKIFKAQTYAVREAHGFVWVWHGEERAAYPPLPLAVFDGLERHIHTTFRTAWHTHYSRAIQGLLDVSHLPFVHAKTIGRGGLTLVNGPYTVLEADRLLVWITNQPDVGLPAIKPTEVPPPDRPADLRLHFPNLWSLWLGEAASQVIVAAPIDDEHTMLYVRFYQRMVTQPVLGKAVAVLGNLYNRYVVHEDKLIIESQTPKRADLEVGERFIPGDRPIALYLQQRRRLILAARQAQDTLAESADRETPDQGLVLAVD